MGAEKRKPDFGGYATKAGVKCTDGRTIMPDAFKHQDKVTVPLVYQHGHTEIDNILGHVELHNREDGVYCYGYFNQTPQGKNSKELVAHGDLKSLSIFANKLIERGSQVIHGMIREVSLVLAGANPGATIDFVEIQHGDGSTTPLEDEAVISFGEELVHGDAVDAPAAQQSDGPTVKEVYDSMTPEQQDVVGFMVTEALKTSSTAAHSATGGEQQKDDKKSEDSQGESKKELAHNENGKDGAVKNNVFDQNGDKGNASKSVLSHDDLVSIVKHGQEIGSFKKAVEEHALKHGINDIELLFPDAKAVSSTPEFDSRRMEWVSSVLTGTKHSPFSRIKSLVADITHDQARAKGYIKGSMKKEEFFGLTKRTTGPTTIYKKQKLDRDDIIDITEMDVVMWLWGEMRLMLDEELARAILIGDGRAVDDEDKIKDPAGAQDGLGIRSILHDADLYAATINVNVDDAGSSPNELVDAIIGAQKFYKGSGNPVFYTTLGQLTDMLLSRDTLGRRLYRTTAELANELGVSSIVTVEPMEDEDDLIGIIVNLTDYTVGTDRGGEIARFDDFDIDYNQYKYLIETRLSGALTKIRSALVIKKVAAEDVSVSPTPLAFNPDTGVITYAAQTGVVYKRADTDAVVSANITLSPGDELNIYAEPASGYFFPNNVDDNWDYAREA